MGPKKKAKGKSKANGNAQEEPKTEWDDLNVEELEKVVAELEDNHRKVQSRRNYAQTEHDAVHSYYEVTRQKLHDIDLQIEEADRRIEGAEEDNAVELRVYQEKINHIKYGHARRLQEAGENGKLAVDGAKEEHENRLQELEEARRRMRQELQDMEVARAGEVEDVKSEYGEKIKAVRENMEAELEAFRQKCDARHCELISDLELERKAEMRKMEEQANDRLHKLGQQHRERYEEAKAYFNGITKENLDVIRNFKNEISRMEEASNRARSKMDELADENRRLSEPLSETTAKVQKLKEQTRDMEKDRLSLRNTKARILVTEDRLEALKEEYRVLQEKFDSVQEERNELQRRFDETVQSARKRTSDEKSISAQREQVLSEA